MKAMLLAAGYGERLLPLTRSVPKPLLPVLGRPMAPQVLRRLAREGIDEAVINLHHLPDPLKAALGDGTELGLRRLHYSMEPERLLGTGGGLEHAAEILRGAGPILVRNSDFLADIPLSRVLAEHTRSGCPATIVLAPHRGAYTPIELDPAGRVRRFGAPGNWLFTGYHLIDESVLDLLPRGVPSDIVRDVYVRLASEGRLNAFVHHGFWWEFGTPREYLDGSLRLVGLSTEARVALGEFDPVREVGDALVSVGPGVEFRSRNLDVRGRAVVGFGTRLESDARVEDTVILGEAWIGEGAQLRRAIVGPGAEIPSRFVLEDAIACADIETSAPLPPATERVDGLLVRSFATAGR